MSEASWRSDLDAHKGSRTLLVASAGSEAHIVRECPPGSCNIGELQVERLALEAAPNQILLTGSGRWLTYRLGSQIISRDLDAADSHAANVIGGPGAVDQLIGALRGGDWIIYRSWGGLGMPGENDDEDGESTPPARESELWAWYAGELPPDQSERPHFRIGGDLKLSVAAIGYRHIVARRLLDGEREELYLVRIAGAKQTDFAVGDRANGEPVLLAQRDQSFSRVVLTDGPSPAQRGELDTWPELPTDVEVVATVGDPGKSRADVSTLVFDVARAEVLSEFPGAVYTSRVPLDNVAGLDPVSPNRRLLSYVTRRGSLAIHDLELHSECTLRSSGAGVEHAVSGFSRAGSLYFEAVSSGRDDDARSHDRVQVLDLDLGTLETLGEGFPNDARLKAVPSERYVDEDGYEHPWAVIVNDKNYYAVSEGDYSNERLYETASFLPRSDETLWVVEGREDVDDGNSNPHRLELHRVQPFGGANGLDFDGEADPVQNMRDPEPFDLGFPNSSKVCVSVSQSRSWTTPWAHSCSTSDRPTLFVKNGVPATETEGAPSAE